MKIITTAPENAQQIAAIVREANKDIAKQFNLNKENNPKHPSFYTKEWVLLDMQRGEEYFICKEENTDMGCVAFEQANESTAYLNRLCVLPKYRHNGIGGSLVNHIVEYSKSKNLEVVSIGIIAAHKVLKTWYSSLGFNEGITQKIDHLPFDVTYMQYEL